MSHLSFLALVSVLLLPQAVLQGVIAKDTSFDPNDCSLYCAVYPTLSVSNHLPRVKANGYGSAELDDGNVATAWVVRGGVGEAFTFLFEQEGGRPGEPLGNANLGIDQLYISNGYNKTASQWRNHGRVRELELAIDGKPIALVRLLDDPHPQAVDLPRTLLHHGMRVRFTIRKTYPGSRFDETAVSEVRLDGYGHH